MNEDLKFSDRWCNNCKKDTQFIKTPEEQHSRCAVCGKSSYNCKELKKKVQE